MASKSVCFGKSLLSLPLFEVFSNFSWVTVAVLTVAGFFITFQFLLKSFAAILAYQFPDGNDARNSEECNGKARGSSHGAPVVT
jgi:hypothetical protein